MLKNDGRALAFVSDGTDLVANQVEQTPPPGQGDYTAVFLADVSTATPTTRLVSRSSGLGA